VGGDGMVRKATDVNQGDLLADKAVFMDVRPEEPVSRSQSAHKSEEVPVMGMEQRGAGRWIGDEQK